MKKASTDTTNKISMCNSNLKVIDFDKLPREFARKRGWCGIPTSNDALYIDVYGKWYFIEFKNGTIPSVDKGTHCFNFIRKNINYILVYNELKYGKTQPSSARDRTYEYIFNLAKQEERLFEIEKFEGYLFHKTYTYTENSFHNKFIQPKELEEAANP